MNNAHLRFGWLTYAKVTERATTNFKVRLDRFIGEVLPDPPRQARAHLISVVGGDTQIAAINAAISLGDRFMIEGPGLSPVRVCLERNAECYKGALLLDGRKKPLRHLIGISEDMSSATSGNTGRTLLASSNPEFVWISLAHIHGLPGIPEWAQWFRKQLTAHQALRPLLGIGCEPVLVKGRKQQFLAWMREGIETGEIRFPKTCGPIQWPHLNLSQVLQQPPTLTQEH